MRDRPLPGLLPYQELKANRTTKSSLLRPSDGTALIVEADKTLRNDVNSVFKHPEMGNVGFEALIDAGPIRGRYMLSVVQEVGGKYLECKPGRATVEISD